MKYLLEEVAKIKMGKMVTSEKHFTRDGIPYITEEALKKLSLEDDTSRLPKVDRTLIEPYSFSRVPAQSILLNKMDLKDTTVYQCKTDVCISHDIIAIIPNESILSSDYLFHFIKWYQNNNEKCNDYRLMIELPSIAIQHQVVQVLNAVQQLLTNKDYLVTAVKELPKHFDNTSRQVKHHSNSLYQGFEQLHYLYIAMLNHIFNGDYLHDFPEYHGCQKLYSN
ncbi:restriction endonuclease subunit S [Lysinibacillus fusiformis]|uniref:restriction endonuclease subunit S n=1 Tax=Lysinibacillus fusiformis TaxID=28031 RepID=UPI0030164FC8